MQINGTKISMTRGDSESILLALENEDGTIRPFAPGDRLYFTVKESAHTAKKALQKIVDSFDSQGRALLPLLPEDTKALACIAYRYDVQLTAQDGQVTTIIPSGIFSLKEEITCE